MKNKKNIIITLIVSVVVILLGYILLTSNNKKTAVLNLPVSSEPSTFNYAKASLSAEFELFSLTSATPLGYDNNGNLVNYAAKDIAVSKDGKKFTITLKDGLTYQDGTKIVAQDYVNAIKILGDPKTKANYSSWVSDWIVGGKDYFTGKAKTIEGVKALSPTKYEINLNAPYSFFKATLNSDVWAPVPQKFIDKVGINNLGVDYTKMLSSGEYKITKQLKGNYIELTKNENNILTKKDLPNKIRLTFYSSIVKQYNDFKRGILNQVMKKDSSDKYFKFPKDKKADYVTSDPVVEYLINGSLSANNAKALYLALDKNYIINKIYYGIGDLRNVITPKSLTKLEAKYHNPSQNLFDIEQAKKLKDPSFNKVKFQIQSASSSPEYDTLVKYIVDQWEKIGVQVEITKVPYGPKDGIMNPSNVKRNFDVAMGPWGIDYPHPQTFFGAILGSKTNTAYAYWQGKSAKKYDSLIEKAELATDENTSLEAYKQAQELQFKEAKLMPIRGRQSKWYIQTNGWNTYVKGAINAKPQYWTKKEQ